MLRECFKGPQTYGETQAETLRNKGTVFFNHLHKQQVANSWLRALGFAGMEKLFFQLSKRDAKQA